MPASIHRHILPPLILHPFSDASSSIRVLESAQAAALMINGGEEIRDKAEVLRTRILDGRYAEFRMLFYVGKDVLRWAGQCADFAQRTTVLADRGFVEQSFAQFLIRQTPCEVQGKLRQWGVADYERIFSRAIGIQAQFAELPVATLLAPDYLRGYYRFADAAYACWLHLMPFPTLVLEEFTFSLFASGEYSQLLEQEWQE